MEQTIAYVLGAFLGLQLWSIPATLVVPGFAPFSTVLPGVSFSAMAVTSHSEVPDPAAAVQAPKAAEAPQRR